MTATAQAMSALAKGNATRLARARFTRRLAELPHAKGKQAVASVLADPPVELRDMRVYDLLRAIHRAGPETAARWCAFAGAHQHRRLSGLTARQVQALREQLGA